MPHKLSKAKSSTFISESADGPAAYTELSELPVHEAFEKLQALQVRRAGPRRRRRRRLAPGSQRR